MIAPARTAVNEDGTLAYSLYQQGAGLVDAYQAVQSSELGCANQGLSIDAGLTETTSVNNWVEQK